jgi:hypothetical protein
LKGANELDAEILVQLAALVDGFRYYSGNQEYLHNILLSLYEDKGDGALIFDFESGGDRNLGVELGSTFNEVYVFSRELTNFVRCQKCGTVYFSTFTFYCPTCGECEIPF